MGSQSKIGDSYDIVADWSLSHRNDDWGIRLTSLAVQDISKKNLETDWKLLKTSRKKVLPHALHMAINGSSWVGHPCACANNQDSGTTPHTADADMAATIWLRLPQDSGHSPPINNKTTVVSLYPR